MSPKPFSLADFLNNFKMMDRLFFLPYHACDETSKKGFHDITNRWRGQDRRLSAIWEEIQSKNVRWDLLLREFEDGPPIPCISSGGGVEEELYFDALDTLSSEADVGGIVGLKKKVTYTFHRDLRGLSWENVTFKSKLRTLDYVLFDNGLFEECIFENFMSIEDSFRNTWFIRCTFKNTHFISLKIANSYFFDCTLENVTLGHLNESICLNTVFHRCTLENVSLCQYDVEQIAFIDSKYSDVTLRPLSKKEYFDLGKGLFPLFTELTETTLHSEAIRETHRGSQKLFLDLSAKASHEHDHDSYLVYHYLTNYFKGRAETTLKGKFTDFLAKQLMGYGDELHPPLVSWAALVLVSSVLLLFSGIRFNDYAIHRSLSFSPSMFFSTLYDWSMCLYFALLTATSLSFDGIYPNSSFSYFVACLCGFLGFLFLTIFTVNLVRRFYT